VPPAPSESWANRIYMGPPWGGHMNNQEKETHDARLGTKGLFQLMGVGGKKEKERRQQNLGAHHTV